MPNEPTILELIREPDETAAKDAIETALLGKSGHGVFEGLEDAGIQFPPGVTTADLKYKWLKSERTRLAEKVWPLVEEEKELDAYLRTIQCVENHVVVERELNIGKLRKRIKRMSTAAIKNAAKQEGEQIALEFASVMWFDFSSCNMNDASDAQNAIRMGRDMISHGVLRLPYKRCVFLATVGNEKGIITVARILEQKIDYEIATLNYAIYSHMIGRWAALTEFEQSLRDYDVLCLLALGSNATEVETRDFAGVTMETREAPPSVSYRRVLLSRKTRCVVGTGTHASPRLHWRRGHQRTMRSGRVVWVRPTLVGDADRGLVVHDYQQGSVGAALG